MTYLRRFVDTIVTSFANVFKFEADPDLSEAENVERVIAETGIVAACLSCIQPIPVADILILTPLHTKMCLHIGRIKGFELSNDRALEIVREIMGTVWLAVATQVLIGSFVKILPVAGAVMTFPLNYAATWAIGKVVDYYFDCLRDGRVPSGEQMKELFAQQFRVGREKGEALDRNEIQRKAEELRRKVEARDPSLATETRFDADPEPAGKPAGGRATASSDSGVRSKIKVSLRENDGARKTIGGESELGSIEPAEDPVAPVAAPQPPAAPAAQPAATAQPAQPSGDRLIDQLERLARLRTAGVLTPEEFDAAKKKLLA